VTEAKRPGLVEFLQVLERVEQAGRPHPARLVEGGELVEPTRRAVELGESLRRR
jgi:hypothetical protein